MIKLEENQYAQISPLFHELRYNLVIDSILDGNTPARIYSDNPSSPKSALIWNKPDTLLLAGDYGNQAFIQDLRTIVLQEIVPDARSRRVYELILHYHPKAWEQVITQSLNSLEPTKALRMYFNFDQPKLNWRNRLPDRHRIVPISQPLLQDADSEQIQDLTSWIKAYWRTLDDFLKAGFGYCLLRENEILSWCLSVYSSGKDHELALATQPSEQGMSFATMVAAACVEYCSQNDLNPHWHSWNDDQASVAIAKRVGFENPVKYPVYRLQA